MAVACWSPFHMSDQFRDTQVVQWGSELAGTTGNKASLRSQGQGAVFAVTWRGFPKNEARQELKDGGILRE